MEVPIGMIDMLVYQLHPALCKPLEVCDHTPGILGSQPCIGLWK